MPQTTRSVTDRVVACDVCLSREGRVSRSYGEKIIGSATDVVAPGTFALASGLAAELIEAGAADYDAVVLVYNEFVNAAVYKQMYKVVKPLKAETEEGEEILETYEFEPDEKSEALVDMYEFLLASEVFHSFMDGAASEQSSRMTAMENASKNANEMIDSLTLQYNRARQARITTELIEIICKFTFVNALIMDIVILIIIAAVLNLTFLNTHISFSLLFQPVPLLLRAKQYLERVELLHTLGLNCTPY